MKKTHGVLSLLGWGLFLPCGAILARYLRHMEPLWYYLHVVIQFLGFILGIAAIVVGLSLNHRLQAHITSHKTIGIFVLVFAILQVFLITLASLTMLKFYYARAEIHTAPACIIWLLSPQVMAFFARPSKDSKNRKYWNLYHFWIGRIAIFLAAVNIVLGIHIGGEGSAWKIGYGFILGFIITTCMVLEALSRLRRSNDPAFPPNFQMNNIQHVIWRKARLSELIFTVQKGFFFFFLLSNVSPYTSLMLFWFLIQSLSVEQGRILLPFHTYFCSVAIKNL